MDGRNEESLDGRRRRIGPDLARDVPLQDSRLHMRSNKLRLAFSQKVRKLVSTKAGVARKSKNPYVNMIGAHLYLH